MQVCVLMKERENAIKTRPHWYRKKTDSCLCSLLNAVLWNCRTVSGIEGSHALGRNLENVTSGVLWTGHVMLAWVTLPGCFKQIQNRGFKPAMMGDLRPAKPGCSLVPHKAENRNVEGEGREQLVQRDGTASDVFGIHKICTASPRTPNLVSCSRCGVWTPEFVLS